MYKLLSSNHTTIKLSLSLLIILNVTVSKARTADPQHWGTSKTSPPPSSRSNYSNSFTSTFTDPLKVSDQSQSQSVWSFFGSILPNFDMFQCCTKVDNTDDKNLELISDPVSDNGLNDNKLSHSKSLKRNSECDSKLSDSTSSTKTGSSDVNDKSSETVRSKSETFTPEKLDHLTTALIDNITAGTLITNMPSEKEKGLNILNDKIKETTESQQYPYLILGTTNTVKEIVDDYTDAIAHGKLQLQRQVRQSDESVFVSKSDDHSSLDNRDNNFKSEYYEYLLKKLVAEESEHEKAMHWNPYIANRRFTYMRVVVNPVAGCGYSQNYIDLTATQIVEAIK